jgi:hypothetical protein
LLPSKESVIFILCRFAPANNAEQRQEAAGSGTSVKAERSEDNAMGFIPLPGGIKVEIFFDIDGQVCVNVHWCTRGFFGAVDYTDTTNAALALETWWNAYRSSVPAGVTATQVRATAWDVAGGVQYVKSPLSNPAGTVISPLEANNVTLAQKMVTGFTGRSNHGRTYLVGLNTAAKTDNDHVTAAFQTAAISAMTAFRAALTAASLVHVVASFVTGGVPRPNGTFTPIISTAFQDNVVDSQRRRLPGRGL